MTVIEAPELYGPTMHGVSVFLAGGITGCPDWQAEAIARLLRLPGSEQLAVLNPRRANFPIGNPDAAYEQIRWEHTHLKRACAILFWFPCETLCPIVLYELGFWAGWRSPGVRLAQPIFVGTHLDYARIQDVRIQLELERPEVSVVHALPELVAQFGGYLSERLRL